MEGAGMIDFLTALKELVPIFGPVPPANNMLELLMFSLQYDPFEISMLVAAVLFDIAFAAEMLAFLEHGRNHENDLRPLAWVRYVVYGYNRIHSAAGLELDSLPRYETLSRYLAGVAWLGALCSLGYYNFAVSTVPIYRAGESLILQIPAMFSLTIALCGALFPIVAGPIIYLSTLRRALAAF